MSLSFVDLDIMEQIIRMCQARGAFKIEETPEINTLYQKILQVMKQERDKQERDKQERDKQERDKQEQNHIDSKGD